MKHLTDGISTVTSCTSDNDMHPTYGTFARLKYDLGNMSYYAIGFEFLEPIERIPLNPDQIAEVGERLVLIGKAIHNRNN